VRRALATASLCAAAAISLVLPSGCAETDELSDRLSKARYLVELRAVVAEVRRSLRLAERFRDVSSLDQLTTLVDRTVAEYGRIVDRMEEIDPPEDVADLHNRFTDTLIAAQGTLERANESLQAGDLAALLGLADEVQGLAQDFSGLSVDYAERGYDIDPKAAPADSEFAPDPP
jgi:hypothetical protein